MSDINVAQFRIGITVVLGLFYLLGIFGIRAPFAEYSWANKEEKSKITTGISAFVYLLGIAAIVIVWTI